MKDLGEGSKRRRTVAKPTARPFESRVIGIAARASGPAGHETPGVRHLLIDEDHVDQRIDNFLLRELKGVPRSHIYRLLRGGEVRVNGGRVDATHRLQAGDQVRVPPVRTAAPRVVQPPQRDPGFAVAYEDEVMLVIAKPSGVAVHGGSGISFGVIEQLRAARPANRFLELVHRLDRETSGLLMIAKKRSALTGLQNEIRERSVHKAYFALVQGKWVGGRREVDLPLRKYLSANGERRVSVDRSIGKLSRTIVEPVRICGSYSLLKATLKTGRTHQIRVHLAHLGYPILGDDKYGDFELNKRLAKQGLKRMFLHAAQLGFAHPVSGERIDLEAPLPPDLQHFLETIDLDASTL